MNKPTPQDMLKSANEQGILKTIYSAFGGDVSITISVNEQAEKIAIEDLDLSVRGYNALKRGNISCMRELLPLIKVNLLPALRIVNAKTENEIKVKFLKTAYEAMTDQEKLSFFETLISENA